MTLSLTSGSLKAGTTSLYCRFGADGAAVVAAVSFENGGASVSCVSPVGTAGTSVPVQVSYDGQQFVGTSESLFWYYAMPDPTKITPAFGTQLGGTAVTVTFDGAGGDPLATLAAQAGGSARSAAAADLAACRFNGPRGAVTSAGVTRYSTSDTGEFCVVCVAPSRGKAGGRERVRLEVSLDGGQSWSAETEHFTYLDIAFYGIVGLDESELGGGAASLATEHLPGGTGSLCATGIKPSNGPSVGGTTVTVTAAGGLPRAHSEVFCYFGAPVNTFVYASSVTHDATGAGSIVAECTAPAGTALTTVFVGISPDGFTAPTAGADFHYHEPILETQGDTLVADPKGTTSVTFSLITSPLPATGVDADEVVAACRFGASTWADAKTVAGVYTAGSGVHSKGKVVCTAPGFEGTKAHFAVPVYVSLNGGKDFGTGHSRTFTYKTDDIRGIIPGQGTWDGPTAAQVVAHTAVSALAYKAISATGACTTWSQDHYATASEVVVYGVVTLPDGSMVHVPAESTTKTGDESYAVTVPASASKIALSLKLSDSMATAVFSGAAVPRRYDASDTAAPIQITAGVVETIPAVTIGYGGFSAASAPLSFGANALNFDVIASDDTTTRQYDLAVTRAPGRSYAALASFPELAETNFKYTLEFNSVAAAYLSGQSFYGIALPEPFGAEVYYGYSTQVRADAPTLDVTAMPTDAYASVRMRSYGANGATTTTANWVTAAAAAGEKSNARTASVGLVTGGISTVEVEVTAQDGVTTAVYYLEVTRSLISSNARLSNVLLVGTGDRLTCAGAGECLENWPLVTTPVMDPSSALREYKIVVASSLMSAKINPVADGQRYKTMTVTADATGAVQDVTSTGLTSTYTLAGNADPNAINTAETETKFTIVITAEDEVTVETYKITVTRPAASTDATLTKMFTENPNFSDYYGHMVPTFDGRNATLGTSTNKYKSSTPYFLSTIQLRPLAASAKVYKIVITAADGPLSFGTANANRTVASNSTLAFTMPNTLSQSWVYADANSGTRRFASATTSFTVEVTAEDRVTTRTYHFDVTREDVSNNTQLQALQPLDVDSSATYPKSGVFTYPFSRSISNYFMEVESHFATIRLQPWAWDERSTMTIGTGCPDWDGNCGANVTSAAITNGTASGNFSLAAGANTTLRILVTSESHFTDPNAFPVDPSRGDSFPPNPDKKSRVYHNIVIYRRQKSNSIILSAIYLRWRNIYWNVTTDFEFTLTPTFAAGTLSYTATVAHNVDYITVTAVAPDTTHPYSQYDHYPRVSIAINDGETLKSGVTSSNRALAVGPNTLNLKVTAESGAGVQTYTVVVTRAPPANESRLASLSVDAKVPGFLVTTDNVTNVTSNVSHVFTRTTELVKVSAGAGATTRDVNMTGFDRDHAHYMLRDPLQRYTYLAHQPINGLAVEHNVTSVEVDLKALSVFANDYEGEVAGQPKTTATLNGAPFQLNFTHNIPLPEGIWPNPSITELTWVVTAQDGASSTYSLTVVRAAAEPNAAFFVKYFDSVRAPEADTAWAGRELKFQFAVNVERWKAAFPFATAGPGAGTPAAAPDVSAIPRMEWHVTSKYNSSGWGTSATETYTSNSTLSGYVAEAATRPVMVMPADGVCEPGSGSVCRHGFCQNATSGTFEEFTAYPPVGDIRWNRTSTLVNDYRFAGKLGYPCSKDVNWTEIAQVANATHYVWDAAHGSTAGNAGTVHVYNVSYGFMSIYHSVVTVPSSYPAGPYTMTIAGRDKYRNIITGTARTYEAPTIEGMVCPPDTNLTAPAGTSADCLCGFRTNCDPPTFGVFSSLGDGSFRGNLSLPIKGNNSLYISASYATFSGYTGGFGGGVERHESWPVRALIVPNVVSIRSRVVTAPVQYRAGGSLEFQVQAVDIYGNDITEGGEAANFTTYTVPATYDFKNRLTPHKVEDLNTGRYKVTVETVLAANYNISFTVNGVETLQGPWVVTVLAAGVTARSTALYPTTVVAGIDNKFLIQPRDVYDNVVTIDDELGGTCTPSGNTNNCPIVVTVYDENLNELPITSSKPWFEYVNNTYYGHFSPPTNSTRFVYIRVFYNGVGIVGSDAPGKYVDIIPGPAEYGTSDFYINNTQGVGYVFVGVYPRDQFGNPCDFERPSEFEAWVTDDRNSSRIETKISDVRYYGMPGTETIVLDKVERVGQYEIQLLLRGVAFDITGTSPKNITVIPGPIATASDIMKVPDSVPVSQTTTLLVTGYDLHRNKVLEGGEAGAITVDIKNPLDSQDVIVATVEDLNNGNYIIAFSPGKSGNYMLVVSFYGKVHGSQNFVAELLNAIPGHFSVKSDAITAGTNKVHTSAGKRVDFTIASAAVLDLNLDKRTNVTVTARYLGVNGVPATGAAAAASALVVTDVDSVNRERHFHLSRTLAGEYEISVMLFNDHVAASPYILKVAGGSPVNHLGAGRKGLLTASYPNGTAPPDGPALKSNLSFTAGTPIQFDVNLRDEYGNVATIDVATDLLVKYSRLSSGEVVTATITRSFEGNATGFGYKATVTLARIGTYKVTAQLGSASLCLPLYEDAPFEAASTCILDADVLAAQADATTSLLQGSGTQAVTAGDDVSLRVVPLDAFGNIIAEAQSRYVAKYTVNITAMEPASANITSGEVVVKDQPLSYVLLDDSHAVSYTLRFAGTYEVAVTQIAPGSPRLVGGTVVNMTVSPAGVDVARTLIDVLTPERLAAEDGAVEVRLRDAFDNLLERDRTSSIAVTIQPTGDGPGITVESGAVRVTYPGSPVGLHLLRYNIPTAETYTVLLSVDAIPVPVSKSLVVTPGPAVAAASTAQGVGLQSAVAGRKATFAVFATDSYGNVRNTPETDKGASGGWSMDMSVEVGGRGADSASCETGKVSSIPADQYALTWSDDTKRYEATYTVIKAGVLSIRVNLAGGVGFGGALRNSPFSAVVVAAGTHAPSCILSGTAVVGTVLDVDGVIHIKALDQFSNERTSGGDPFALSIKARGTNETTVTPPPILLDDRKDGTYTVTYKPKVAWLYLIEIILRGEAVGVPPNKSPLFITVNEEPGPVSVPLSEARGPGLSRAVAGVATSFTITAVDVNGIRATTGGLAFVITLTSFNGASKINLVRKMVSEAGADGSNVVRDNADGTYTVTYIVEKEGRYQLDVQTTNGETLKLPPGESKWPAAVVVYAGTTSAKHSKLDDAVPLPASSVAGQRVTTRILARDANNNTQCYAAEGAGGDPFEVKATISGEIVRNSVLNLNLTQNKAGGYYDVSMAPTQSGDYEFVFKLRGDILGTAFAVFGAVKEMTVRAGPLKAALSIVTGPAILGGPAGKSTTASVEARDEFGNAVVTGLDSSVCATIIAAEFALEPGAILSASANCSLTDAGLGKFTVNVLARSSGKYTLNVTLNGEHAGFSPYRSVSFDTGLSDAAATTVVGAGTRNATAGENTTVTVQVRDEYGNRRPSGGDVVSGRIVVDNVDLWGVTVDNGDGSYALTYAAPREGSFELEVMLGTSAVMGSPFTLAVLPSATSAALSFAEDVAAGTAGSNQTFVVRAVNVHGGLQAASVNDDFKLAISPSGNTFGQTLQPSAVKRSAGEGGGYAVNWRADRILYNKDGTVKPYLLNVTLGGVHIRGSPFSLRLRPARAAAANTIIFNAAGGLMRDELNAVAGVEQRMVVQTRDAFNNDGAYDAYAPSPLLLNVVLTGKPNGTAAGATVPVVVQNLLNGIYRVSYVAETSGAYGLAVTVDGAVIGGGDAVPIVVEPGAMSPEHFAVWGPGATEPVLVGQANEFRVQTRDAYGNNRVDDGSLNQAGGYTLDVEIRVRVGDVYSASVTTVKAYPDPEDTGKNLTYWPDPPEPMPSGENRNYTAGTYTVPFKVKVLGMLVTYINVNREGAAVGPVAVAGSPYQVPVNPRNVVSGSMSGIGTESAALAPGSATTTDLPVTVTPRDQFGNMAALGAADPARFALTVSSSFASVAAALAPDGTGNLRGSWRAVAAGDVTVSVTFDGVHVAGSPKTVKVNATYGHINPERCRHGGPALEGGVVGRETHYLIELFTDEGAAYPMSADDHGTGACVPGSPSRGYVQVILDDIPMTGENGKVVDNCNGTYTAIVTHRVAGPHRFQTFLGPGPVGANPNFPNESPRGLGGVGFEAGLVTVTVYSSRTAAADVVYRFEAAKGVGHSGVPTEALIYPKDAFGNKQDYRVFPVDGLRAQVTANDLQNVPVTLTRRFDVTTVPETTHFLASFVPKDVGKYVVEFDYLRPDGTRKKVGGAYTIDVAPGTPSPVTSVVSGTGVASASAGVEAFFRVQLNDAAGNPAFNGSYVAPDDAANLPGANAPQSSGAPAPPIPVVEANLIPYGGNASHAGVFKATLEYLAEEGVYLGRYTATKTGRYTLEVLLYGAVMFMGESYLYTDVNPGDTATSESTANGAGVGTGGLPISAGEAGRVVIVSRDAFSNALTTGGSAFVVLARSATYSGVGNPTTNPADWTSNLDALVAPPIPADRGDGTYLTTFVPTVAATYLVSVTRSSAHIKGSPYLLTVTPAATSALHSMLVCTSTLHCGLDSAVAGTRATFYVVAKDRFNNTQVGSGGTTFYYSVVGSGGFTKVAVASSIGITQPGWFEAFFNTEVAGALTIRVTLGSELVREVNTKVSSTNVRPDRCTISSRAFPVATAGNIYEVTVTARDDYSNQLTSGGLPNARIALEFNSGGGVMSSELLVKDNNDGTYVANMQLQRIGTWTVRPSFGGVGVTPTQFRVTAGAMDLRNTLVNGETTFYPGPFTAGEPAVLTFTFKDALLNERYVGDDLSSGTLSLIVTTADQGTSEVAVTKTEFFNETSTDHSKRGKYFVHFIPQSAGLLTVKFVVGSETLVNPADGLPFTATIKPSTYAVARTTLFGAGLQRAAMGRNNNVNVLARDNFMNPITVQPVSASGAKLDIKCVFFAVGVEGTHPGAAAIANMNQSTVYIGNGVSSVYYNPPDYSADYVINVQVTIDGVPVPTSVAYNVIVSKAQGAAPLNSIILDTSLRKVDPTAFVTGFRAGSEARLIIEPRDPLGAPVAAASTDFVSIAIAPVVPVTLELTSEGRVALSFSTNVSGEYSLNVKAGTPEAYIAVGGNWPDGVSDPTIGQLRVIVSPAARSIPAQTTVLRLPRSPATAGLSTTLRLQSRDEYGNPAAYDAAVGADRYRATLNHVEAARSAPVHGLLTNNEDGTYDLTFKPTVSGRYSLSVTLDDTALPATSDQFVDVVHAEVFAASSTFSPNLATVKTQGVAGQLFSFGIEARDSFSNLHSLGDQAFVLTVTPPAGAAEVEAAVTPKPSGTYAATFTPLAAGEYTLTLRHVASGLRVLENFVATVVPGTADASKVVISGGGSSGGTAGATHSITITVRDANNNLVSDPAEGIALEVHTSSDLPAGFENSKPAVTAVLGQPGTLTALYKVVGAPGIYWLAVRLKGQLVPGSPFRLDISPTPAPAVRSATLAPSLMQIDVTFDQDTDLGEEHLGGVSGAGCDAFFDAATVADAGGTSASCVWVSEATLAIFFGASSTMTPGSTVTLKSGVIKTKDGLSHPASGSTVVTVPWDSTDPDRCQKPGASRGCPVAAISAPQTVGPCDAVVLDGSASQGGGGRPLRYEFGVDGEDAVAAAIVAATATATAKNDGLSPAVIALDATVLTPGTTYVFSVKVTDFVGGWTVSKTTTVKSGDLKPEAQILGRSSRTARRSEAVTLEAAVSLPARECVQSVVEGEEDKRAVKYQWSLVKGPLLSASDFPSPAAHALHLSTLNAATLYIPPKTLSAGQTYTWRLRSSDDTNQALYTDALVDVAVSSSPIEPNLVTGAVRSAYVSAPLHMEVNPIDPDDAKDSSGSPYPFTYAWSCATPAGAACDLPVALTPSTYFTSSPKVTFPANALQTGTYVFSVRVAREPASSNLADRDVTVTSTVTLAEPPPPEAGAPAGASKSAATLSVSGPPSGVASPSERLTLRAELAGCPGGPIACGVTWSCVRGDLKNQAKLILAAESGLLNEQLLPIKPGGLTPGQRYVFQAKGTGTAEGLTAETVVDVNVPPRGGRLVAEQVNVSKWAGLGVGKFTLRAVGWSDAPEHYPLSYAFYFTTAGTNERRPLSNRQSAASVTALLPHGTHVLEVWVADAYGAASSATATVTVSPPAATGRRRGLLQSVTPATDYQQLAIARLLLTELVRPAVNLGVAPQVFQAAYVYAARFAKTPSGAVIGGCAAPGTMATEHAEVAAALRSARDSSPRTGPGVTQALCAAAPLASDVALLSQSGAADVAGVLALDAAAASAAGGPELDGLGLACATELASNLIAAEVSGCFGSPPPAASRGSVSNAVYGLAAAAGRGLLPGALPLVHDATHLALAVRSAEPSAGVGVPLIVEAPGGKAKATYALASEKTGGGFTGGPGAMVVSVAHFREGSPVSAAAAASMGERLVSNYTTLGLSHPDAAAASAAVDTLEVTLAYDAAGRTAAANAGRYPTTRFYDAQLAAAATAANAGARYPGWLETGLTARPTEDGVARTVTGTFRPLPAAQLSMAVVMIDIAPPPPPPPISPPPANPPPSPPPPSPSPPPAALPPKKDDTQLYIIAGACAGGGLLLGLVAFGVMYATRKNAAATRAKMKDGPSTDPGGVRFDPFGGRGGGGARRKEDRAAKKAAWDKRRREEKGRSQQDVEAGGKGGGWFGRGKPSKVSPMKPVVSKPFPGLRQQAAAGKLTQSARQIGRGEQALRSQRDAVRGVREREEHYSFVPEPEIDTGFIWEGASKRGAGWDGDYGYGPKR